MRTGIILAGGKSSRMGQNKALLPIRGKTVIEHITSELAQVTDRLLIVTNSFADYQFLKIPMVEDHWKEKGPLAGIQAGLQASDTDENLVVACDMPFISTTLATYLFDQLADDDVEAVVPNLDGQLHPLFAVYRKRVAEVVGEALQKDELRIRLLFNNINTRLVTEADLQSNGILYQPLDVFNMNHPEEYEQAVHFTAEGRDGR